jgi:hypothetical protein
LRKLIFLLENIIPAQLQEIIFGSSIVSQSKLVSRLEKLGKIRKIAPRIYSSNLTDSPGLIIKRNLFYILGNLFPQAVLSHRSALELQPGVSGNLFLSYSYTKKTKLPGITLRFLEGPGPATGDSILAGALYVSSFERALLENLQVSKQTGPDSKILLHKQLEDRLEQYLKTKGRNQLMALLGRAQKLSEALNMPKEFLRLKRIITGMVTPVSVKDLSSPMAIARAFGQPYDAESLSLLEKLFVELKQLHFKNHPDRNSSPALFSNMAFFETWFSVTAEGLQADLADCKQMIATNSITAHHREDAATFLGSFQIVSNQDEMMETPDYAARLIELLQSRYNDMTQADLFGVKKEYRNHNSLQTNTRIVDFDLIKGSLIKAFDYYNALQEPFARAVYMLFMITEISPFETCNGLLGRIMMNAELVKAQQSKIIIPRVYLPEYRGAIKRLQKLKDARAYIKMLQNAWDFTSTKADAALEQLQKMLDKSQAFSDPEKYKLKL